MFFFPFSVEYFFWIKHLNFEESIFSTTCNIAGAHKFANVCRMPVLIRTAAMRNMRNAAWTYCNSRFQSWIEDSRCWILNPEQIPPSTRKVDCSKVQWIYIYIHYIHTCIHIWHPLRKQQKTAKTKAPKYAKINIVNISRKCKQVFFFFGGYHLYLQLFSHYHLLLVYPGWWNMMTCTSWNWGHSTKGRGREELGSLLVGSGDNDI